MSASRHTYVVVLVKNGVEGCGNGAKILCLFRDACSRCTWSKKNAEAERKHLAAMYPEARYEVLQLR